MRYIYSIACYVIATRCHIIAGVFHEYYVMDDYGQLTMVNNQFWREVENRAESNFS